MPGVVLCCMQMDEGPCGESLKPDEHSGEDTSMSTSNKSIEVEFVWLLFSSRLLRGRQTTECFDKDLSPGGRSYFST
ncbi:hypothetical protein AMECASPLE_035412 [Ameca splendens]|uniref:Uncharacterized protein n=1 Tax=Ameca splendens TaxID=208324 RepID=A0ABV0Z6B4_9TELE